jgi:hypothetical protein
MFHLLGWGKLAALAVSAAVLAACTANPELSALGSQAGPSPRWASRCAVPARGCVFVENFEGEAVHIVEARERPAPGNLVPARAGSLPGRGHLVVDSTRSTADFAAVSGAGMIGAVTCRIRDGAWGKRNPVVAWRGGELLCAEGW